MSNLAHLSLSSANQSKSYNQYKEALVWFRKLSLQDPQLADPYYNLGKMHEYGLGTKIDFKSAFQYYKKAATLNHSEAMSKCGDFVYSGRLNGGLCDKNEAIKYYKKAAELGSSTAINSLGLMTENKNKEEALKLYR